jgi:hypothetical protein
MPPGLALKRYPHRALVDTFWVEEGRSLEDVEVRIACTVDEVRRDAEEEGLEAEQEP